MKRWPTKPLGEVAKVIRGVSFDKSQVSDEPGENTIPILRAGNIQETLLTDADLVHVPAELVSSEQLMRRGDLAICMSSGSPTIVGKTAHLTNDWRGSVGAFCAIVRFNASVHHRFGSYWFRSPTFLQWRDANVKGANIQNLRRAELEKLPFPVPPLAEQERIVKLLDEADALRKLRAQADHRTAALLPALFHQMFGDPTTNPKGWPEVRLVDVTSPKQWPTVTQEQLTEFGYPVYGANGRIGFYSEYNHEDPTVLITCRGATCGTINVSEPKSYVTGNSMALDKPNFDLVNLPYLEWVLRIRGVKDTISGTAQPQITRQSLARVSFPLPPLSLQQEFGRQVCAIRELEAAQAASRRRLDELFQSLLHRAFAGEL
jgi:type I restriction enzyme S subunit